MSVDRQKGGPPYRGRQAASATGVRGTPRKGGVGRSPAIQRNLPEAFELTGEKEPSEAGFEPRTSTLSTKPMNHCSSHTHPPPSQWSHHMKITLWGFLTQEGPGAGVWVSGGAPRRGMRASAPMMTDHLPKSMEKDD